MDIQTFYPVFETGQVLTSLHLNDIVDYLEPQDRLTRTRLTGLGIVCGLEPDWDSAAKALTLSCGAAITSEGYLIAEDEVVLDRYRPYSVPIPSGPGATTEQKARARYSFLFDGSDQREAYELLPTDFQPGPGEAPLAALSDAFVSDKTVILFLECSLESLKNCDINDCSDKGSEMNLTLRRLLVTRAIADRILDQEEEIAGRPVDRANHPRLDLAPLSIEKINPANHEIDTLSDLYDRILSAAANAGDQLLPAMRDAWDAYQPLLEDMFPASRFPNGPIPKHHFLNMLAAFAETPALVQYLHGGMHDILRSYNEFIVCAARFDADCCPEPGRFPKHVLAGDVEPRPVAFGQAPSSLADYAAYNPLTAIGGPAPEGVPAARRHHIEPSLALDAGNDKLAELRSVFSRMVLLAQTYATRGLLGAEIGLTPSRDGAAPLGERAIPFYYRFKTTGDLLRNWSWRKSRSHLLGSVFSHQFSIAAKVHPLLPRQDDQDFVRIEGIVGKPLGTTMAELIQQKQALGVSFAIEPVWIGYGTPGADGAKLDEDSKALAQTALKTLLLCRMRDLDVIFLMIMAALFAFMVWIVQALGRLDATKALKQKNGGQGSPSEPGDASSGDGFGFFAKGQHFGVLNLDPEEQSRLRGVSDSLLVKTRKKRKLGDDVVKQLVDEGAGDQPLAMVAVGSVYDKVRDKSIGGELFDRVRVATGELGIEGDKDALTASIYPSVALMARAEEMMQVTSVASIAEFDEAKFGTAFNGFADAYQVYADKAETDPEIASKEIVDTNKAIVANRTSIVDTASQFSGAAITDELNKRLLSMFEDLILLGYARKHPGLEHKAGVPVGGTLVLVYGSRYDIDVGMKKAMGELSSAFDGRFSKLVEAAAPSLAVDKTVSELLAISQPQSEDVLDQFVVLGDFCLPYHCCETDCSDVEVLKRIIDLDGVVTGGDDQPPPPEPPPPPPEPPEPPPPPPPPPPEPPEPEPEPDPEQPDGKTGNVEVSVVHADSRPAAGAIVTITNLATGEMTTAKPEQPTEVLQLEPEAYVFSATLQSLQSEPEEVLVETGVTTTVKLVLNK